MYTRATFIAMLAAPILLIPQASSAQFTIFQTRSAECLQCGNCSVCDLVVVVTNVGDAIMTISGALALLMFILGGSFLLVSSGNANLVDRGKRILIGTIFGLSVIFAAWIITNTVVAGLTGANASTPAKLFGDVAWNEVCGQPSEVLSCKGATGPTIRESVELKGFSFGLSGSEIRYQGEQIRDASPILLNKLNCVGTLYRERSGGDIVTVTSISDDNLYIKSKNTKIVGATCTGECQHCEGLPPPCTRSNSLHYSSRAADLQTKDKTGAEQALQRQVAAECGFTGVVTESNHLHVSF